MAGVHLYDFQLDALGRMHNGCILNGGVGSGKSRTSLAYYYIQNGGLVYKGSEGQKTFPASDVYVKMKKPQDLYIITTARKRDTLEWEQELLPYALSTDRSLNLYSNKVVIDSWNNISKYTSVSNAFFIFDEQRVVGYGTWVKSFLKITQANKWILLSATPGDTWTDYMPVFIANGYYRNKTDFYRKHVVMNPYITKFPSIMKYTSEGHLQKLRRSVLIDMDFQRKTTPHHIKVMCEYDAYNYNYIVKNRMNIYTNFPIQNASEYCQCLRRLVNEDESRKQAVLDIIKEHPKVIIFYTYDYELDVLRKLLCDIYTVAEWNGHKHDTIPTGETWAYLIQYTAGCEGWNCITTDTIIFYSQSYSYKMMEQASGRINRLNTPYKDLYYYHLKSKAQIDLAVSSALNKKKKFNERAFAPEFPTKVTTNE